MSDDELADEELAKETELYDVLMKGEIEEKHCKRSMGLYALAEAFEMLGIDEKLEQLEPHIRQLKGIRVLYTLNPEDMASLRKVIEFIECLDEP